MSQSVAVMLRNQAWERAKGEINAAITTFYSQEYLDVASEKNGGERAAKATTLFKAFVDAVENEGLMD